VDSALLELWGSRSVPENLPRTDAWLGRDYAQLVATCTEFREGFLNAWIEPVLEHPDMLESSTVRCNGQIDPCGIGCAQQMRIAVLDFVTNT
jgi:hypothetical protein